MEITFKKVSPGYFITFIDNAVSAYAIKLNELTKARYFVENVSNKSRFTNGGLGFSLHQAKELVIKNVSFEGESK